jgi:uncharacterized protein
LRGDGGVAADHRFWYWQNFMQSNHQHNLPAHLRHVLAHLSHLLPAQGPIGVFIHHNTLHAFQDKPFEEAVLEAAAVYGTEPYMREDAYRAAYQKGRIREADLNDTLGRENDGDTGIAGWGRRRLRKQMLVPGIRHIDEGNVHWMLGEGELEPVQILTLCQRRAGMAASKPQRMPARPRDGVRALHGVDLDEIVNPVLIRLCGAFLDQGLAYWPMPNRGEGFLKAARQVFLQPGAVFPEVLSGARKAFEKLPTEGEELVMECLASLDVAEPDFEAMLRAELLALPGWAGMMHRLEQEPQLAPHDIVPCSLMDFLAVRLVLTLVAVRAIDGSARGWKQGFPEAVSGETQALVQASQIFEAARVCGFRFEQLQALSDANFQLLQSEVLAFEELERRRVWHLAYERRHERQILLPLGEHVRGEARSSSPQRLAGQVFFCIDEREEAIRRHLEEVDPEIETFGAAGFFGVAMNYTGIDDAHGVSLCPVVVTPQHAVVERPHAGDHHLAESRNQRRRLWSRFAWNSFISTRTLLRGWLSTAILGGFSVFPLLTRVLAPRQYSKLAGWLNDRFLPEPRTELTYMRSTEASHHAAEGLMQGFTVAEKVDRVASVLGPAGLHKEMARLVVVLGHGSTSLNNPHESAHDCGACGGRRGGPNGRIFAAMANHPEVRIGLRSKGIHIPEDTWFVGGYHDTCNDDIDLYDLEMMPVSHQGDLNRVRGSLDRAREWSAHERARRFEAAKPGLSPLAALHHVEERAEHLAEPRPEYGHCTNAVAIVGRREISRGLFLDRRAFLISYDASVDPEDENLARVLGAVIPVCGGINLEYYFSFVDNERYGCGTKLPHNITGLVGVMNGFESDLRTGLPWQMVEIHEPVRILFVVETKPERVLRVIEKNPLLAEFLHHRWIRLSTVDPDDGSIRMYRDGVWELVEGDDERLYQAESSAAWYDGHIEHLPMARIARRAV